MIVVTGGAGFIGSNLVAALNRRGETGILVVDDLGEGFRFRNLVGLDIADYMDRAEFLDQVTRQGLPADVRAVFHQGACSDTTEWDGRYMMANNYSYSKALLHACLERRVPFLYASSAAVYGSGICFREERGCERPLNVYAYSKWLFDQYVRSLPASARSQVVGLRYFNVYGPGEQHKGSMASIVYQLRQQLLAGEHLRLFRGCDGYPDGGQQRDFIHVEDVCKVNIWFLENPHNSGVFNLGTGRAESFRAVAEAVIRYYRRGRIDYTPFPEHLRGHYQNFTRAELGNLRAAGYDYPFMAVAEGVEHYLCQLDAQEPTR